WVASNADDGGVDLVIVHGIIRRGAAGQRACTEPYHRKADRPGDARPHRGESLRDGGTVPVIKQQLRRIDRRQLTIRFTDALAAVQRGPVLEETELAVRGLRDLGDAEETAHGRRTGLLDDAVVDQKDEGNDRGERQWRTPEQHARGQERAHG